MILEGRRLCIGLLGPGIVFQFEDPGATGIEIDGSILIFGEPDDLLPRYLDIKISGIANLEYLPVSAVEATNSFEIAREIQVS